MVTVQDTWGALFIAFMIAYGFTPFVRQLAFKARLLDNPERRKSHAHPTPLLGGFAIYVAFFAGILFTTAPNVYLYGIFFGATLLLILGIIDDKLGMMPQMKLSGQIMAALIAYKAGFRVTTFEDYYVSMFFTVFWVVGITNAFNLLDNLNGLSSGIAGIASLFFGVMALWSSQIYTAVVCFALAGACFGFLRHNFPRASIFMGDSGSMVIGFALACIAILGSWKTDTISLSLSLPILILGYPIFDTTLVTFLRLMEKRPVYIGGRDHSSHILASLGFKKRRAVVLIYIISSLLGLAALLITKASVPVGVLILAAASLGMIGFGSYLAVKRFGSAKLQRQNGKR
ncbi:MAG: MraY family glycosyltransferase [Candidatus Omnitrophota bacterium]